ncbi:MAG TPA: hypothetical protein VHQ24_03975, partial [Lachnospiraceae bacterium]|nr:hypothetical protein [Lachnospiraceae bacterium]
EKSPGLTAFYSLDPDVSMYEFTKYYEYTDYSTMAKMYDRNGDVIAESGSMICLHANDREKQEYIYLNDYFSKKQMEQVYEFKRQHKSGCINVKNIEGTRENDKFIPSSVTIIEANTKDELVIDIDCKLTPIISYNRYNAFIDINIIGWADSQQSNQYKLLQKNFPQIKEIKEDIKNSNFGGIANTNYMDSFYEINYHGSTYYYEWSVACDSRYMTLTSRDFRYELKDDIIYIQVIGLVLWLSICLVVRKGEHKEDNL